MRMDKLVGHSRLNKAFRFGTIFLLLGAFCFGLLPVQAQAGSNTVTLSSPSVEAYPRIEVNFWPFDQEGKLYNKLSQTDLHLYENEREIKIDSLELVQPGTHFVIAINEAKTLGNSYSGKTRMARMLEDWMTWAQAQSITTLDDFSLVTNTGVAQNQLTTPGEWVQALNDYQPDLKNAQASLTSLSQAINLLSSLPTTDQKSRAILYVTPLPGEGDLATLNDQANLAAAAKIRLFIWLIGPQSYTTEAATAALQQAATQTGGDFFLFSGAETLPQVSTYLDPYNYEYKLDYTTQIQTTGDYTLLLKIDNKDFQAASDPVNFSLTVQPPNPIFLSPPSTLVLNWVRSSDKKWQITPATINLKFMVEFQDGHSRALKAARLFVDDKLASEDLEAPFDELSWNVSQLTESGKHRLQIYVEDEVGLTAKTIEMPIEVIVNPKPLNAFEKIVEQIGVTNLVIIGFLLLAVLVMIFGLRRLLTRGAQFGKRRPNADKDPLKQEVVIAENEYAVKPQENEPAGWPKLPGGGKAPARLLVLNTGKSIALPASETLLGSDSKHCDVLLSGPTISAVHAQIFTDASKHFYIADKGSAAGTWVNYAPVSSHGTRLEHRDLVNLGALRFKFEVLTPEGRTIQVLPFEN